MLKVGRPTTAVTIVVRGESPIDTLCITMPHQVDKLIGESPYLGDSAEHAAESGAPTSPHKYLLSFVGSVRFHTPGYSMGVRQARHDTE